MHSEEYCYWLAGIENVGNKKIEKLLQVYGTAEEVFHTSRNELYASKRDGAFAGILSDKDLDRITINRDLHKIQDNYAKLLSDGIYFVSKEAVDYPDKLRHLYEAPYALYIKGRLPENSEKLLAVVGARECTSHGKDMAGYFSGILAGKGIGIISGIARGVDAYAHQGALRAGGFTYGILGCGIDICYPRENFNLYMDMQKKGGIISEYAPGMKPYAGNFPKRNRIISALSDGILVVEAKEKSGSLITVDFGLEQGKEVYALPGRATDRLSTGCNNLIKMGAKLVTEPKDILEELFPNYEQNMDEMKKNNKVLEKTGKIVYASLCLEPKHIEEIAAQTGLSMEILAGQLLMLEFCGLIRQPVKNYYMTQD